MSARTQALPDPVVERYATIFSVTRFGALVKTAGCPDASTELISATVATAERRHTAADADQVLVAALTNPAAPAALVSATLQDAASPLATGTVRLLAGGFAAVHRHAAVDPRHWWTVLATNGVVRSKLCENPHVDAAFLAEHAREHPVAVARNPNTAAVTLAELIGCGLAEATDGCSNPSIGDGVLAAAVASEDPQVRLRAYRNPRHSRADLERFRAAELRRSRYDPDVTLQLAALIGDTTPVDPLEVSVTSAVFATYRRDIAATVTQLEAQVADAAAALVSAGFAGTVAELYAVAAATAA